MERSDDAVGATEDSIERWVESALPRDILRALESAKPLEEIAAEVQATDARVLWYLDKLASVGCVSTESGAWIRTEAGNEVLGRPATTASTDVAIMPGRTVYDFQQAFADATAGMFGSVYVQCGGEHGSRLSTEQAEEFADRLVSLIAEYFAPGQGDRSGVKYGLHWILTPTDLHPLDGDR